MSYHWRDVMTRCEHLQGALTKLTQEQVRAMDELEFAGFAFLIHFGSGNAMQKRDEINAAFAEGRLYEYLKTDMGMNTE